MSVIAIFRQKRSASDLNFLAVLEQQKYDLDQPHVYYEVREREDGLFDVDPQDDINAPVVVRLIQLLGPTYFRFELRMDFVINIEGKTGKTICAVSACKGGLHRSAVKIGKVNHRTGQGVVVIVQHLSSEQAACSVIVVFVGKGTGRSKTDQQEHEK